MVSNQKKTQGIHYAWWILIAIIIFFGLGRGGIQNSLGQIYPAAAATFGVDPTVTSMVYLVTGVVGIIWSPIAGRMLNKYNLRFLLAIGMLCFTLSFVCLYFAVNVPLFYVIFVILSMAGALVAVQAGPVLINRWFKAKKGLATGIMMASVGLIGGVIQGVFGTMIASLGWQLSVVILGLAVLVITLPVILLVVRNDPSDKNLKVYGDEDDAEAPQDQQAAVAPSFVPGVPVSAALKTPSFYAVFLACLLITVTSTFLAFLPTLALFLPFADVNLTVVGGLGTMFFMFGTVVGALTFGTLSDKIGARNAGLTAMVIGILAALILLFGTQVHIYFFYGGAFLYGAMATCVGTIVPLITMGIFGPREFPKIFGFIQSALAIGSMIAIPGFTFVLTSTGDIKRVLYIILAIMIAIIILIILAFALAKGLKKYMVPPQSEA